MRETRLAGSTDDSGGAGRGMQSHGVTERLERGARGRLQSHFLQRAIHSPAREAKT